jgi:hypothetical protein
LHNSTGPVSKVGLIFAAQFKGHPELLGLMFDLGFSGPSQGFDAVPREGCAVFINAVRNLRPNDLFQEELIYTAIHELGHVFNLGHLHDPRGFMLPSQVDGSHLNIRDFAGSQKSLLALGDHAPEIEPGGKPYGKIGTLTGGGDYTVMTNIAEGTAPFGLELHIDVAQHEFWCFEPIELDVEVRIARGLQRSYAIPNAVDPGFEAFHILIEEPGGERRHYRPTTRFCSAAAPLAITAQSPFRRDIPLFGEGGGYTFRSAGIHRITTTLRLLDGALLRSNAVEINVLGHSRDDLYVALRDSLTAPGVPEVLFHRSRRARLSVLNGMEVFATKHSWTAAAPLIRYAVARSLLTKCESSLTAPQRRKLKLRAIEHLKHVAGHEKTGSYRRTVAQGLIASEG